MGVYCALYLVVASFLRILSPAEGDAEVSCVFMECCTLPCSFQVDTEVIIHWIQRTTGDTRVHSYYNNQDHLALQDQRFKNRTSLFQDQISGGNASLQLSGVRIQDQGRYQCTTSTLAGNKELIINLKVDALVDRVDIQHVENWITCSSEGIYPQPELTWSTSPPSNVSLENNPTVQQTEQLLYNINSSLIASVTDLVYSCTVSTRTNKRTATLRQLSSISGSSSDTTIPCTSNTSLTGFSLTWRFNLSQLILNQTGDNVLYTEEWRQRVKSVSESGSLTLKALSSDQEGIYTCELSNAEETYVTNTLLRIIKESQTDVAGIVVGVVLGVILVTVIALYCKHKQGTNFLLQKLYCFNVTPLVNIYSVTNNPL
ncbi:V-set domain-containing T-cell activation inhibitor 1-like [Sander vitreus]